jgi:hypothetical protein
MKKYFLLALMGLSMMMLFQSCGSYEKCPAYSSVDAVNGVEQDA